MENELDLICHCIEHMAKKESAQDILTQLGVSYKKSDTLKALATKVRREYGSNKEICINKICKLYRDNWLQQNTEDMTNLHISNLQSNKLKGHNWHKTSPSMLHRGMQDRVRECSAGEINLDKLIEIGADIMRQEYYIVATHDIIESSIIRKIDTVIPPIGGTKSITDFVIGGYPMDLKVSHYTGEFISKAGNMTKEDKMLFAKTLYDGADSERQRKQAEKALHNWGLNRLYVLVKDTEEWFSNPMSIVKRVLNQLRDPDILSVKIEEGYTSVIVVEA